MHQLWFLCLLEAQQSFALHTQLGKYLFFSTEAKAAKHINREAPCRQPEELESF